MDDPNSNGRGPEVAAATVAAGALASQREEEPEKKPDIGS